MLLEHELAGVVKSLLPNGRVILRTYMQGKRGVSGIVYTNPNKVPLFEGALVVGDRKTLKIIRVVDPDTDVGIYRGLRNWVN